MSDDPSWAKPLARLYELRQVRSIVGLNPRQNDEHDRLLDWLRRYEEVQTEIAGLDLFGLLLHCGGAAERYYADE